MRSQCSIFFSIVRLFVPYGMLFSAALVYLGLCLEELLTCLIVGVLLVALGVPLGRKIVPSCFLWCLWREINDRSFEDRKGTLELISFFSSTLYLCIAAFVSLLVLYFHDFLIFFFSSF